MHSERAPLEQLVLTPYIRVLTYPRISLRAAKSRVKQLERMGVTALVFEGHAKVGRLGILGVGTVGIVVKAVRAGELYALKIRRTDANRKDMESEVKVTRTVNRLGIGPEIFAHTKDFVLMRLLEYQELEEWFKGLKGPGTRETVRQTVHQILNQCRQLDLMGIDHGQLSNLRKHAVIADGKPWIIDFESAGTSRRVRNVTSAAQYLLIGGKVSPRVRRVLGIRDTAATLRILSEYSHGPSDYLYSKLLESLGISQQ